MTTAVTATASVIAMTADRVNEMTLVTATEATDLASMIAGTVADLEQIASMNLIGTFQEVAAMRRLQTRRRERGVEAVIETGIGIVAEMTVTGVGARGVGLEVGVVIDAGEGV